MESQKIRTPDSQVVETDMSQMRQLKILTPTHYMYIAQSADGKTFIRAGGGTYSTEGTKYIESIDYSSGQGFLGTKATFEWRTEGDKWYHTGTVGEGENAIGIEEVYHRAKSK